MKLRSIRFRREWEQDCLNSGWVKGKILRWAFGMDVWQEWAPEYGTLVYTRGSDRLGI